MAGGKARLPPRWFIKTFWHRRPPPLDNRHRRLHLDQPPLPHNPLDRRLL